jgi:hypothetical protein
MVTSSTATLHVLPQSENIYQNSNQEQSELYNYAEHKATPIPILRSLQELGLSLIETEFVIYNFNQTGGRDV